MIKPAGGAHALQITQLFALAMLPLAGAVAGAILDERNHFGFTNWRSACRAAGFSFRSVVTFAFELLPTAIIGLLAGGLALLSIAFVQRHRNRNANLCLAAHAGCALTMPIGLSLCALALPLPLMLFADALLAFAAASVLLRISAC